MGSTSTGWNRECPGAWGSGDLQCGCQSQCGLGEVSKWLLVAVEVWHRCGWHCAPPQVIPMDTVLRSKFRCRVHVTSVHPKVDSLLYLCVCRPSGLQSVE